ncbi:CHAT domain-containing protein [Melanogaster broomeanus]|nr:CHAT domain-containing protein [Melanogaster broomeanus]
MQGNRLSLDDEIIKQEALVQNTPDSDPDKLHRLDTLGNCYDRRSTLSRARVDLDQAVSVRRRAAFLTPDADPRRASRLRNLSNSLSDSEAVLATTEIDSGKPCQLHTLGQLLFKRFQISNQLSDLDESFANLEKCVNLTPHGHAHRVGHMRCFGDSSTDIGLAVGTFQTITSLLPDGHVDKLHCLQTLADLYDIRYQAFGKVSDLDSAIATYAALHSLYASRSHGELIRVSHPWKSLSAALQGCPATLLVPKPGRLNNLGTSIPDTAVSLRQEAVRLTKDEKGKVGRLVNLGIALRVRFGATGVSADIDEAIQSHESALRYTSDDDPGKPCRLNNLGNTYMDRFQYSNEPADIDRALRIHQEADSITPTGHHHKTSHLLNLGTAFRHHFDSSGDRGDLDEAVNAHKRVVTSAPEPRHFNNLGNSFLKRFECTQDSKDIRDAIVALEKAVELSRDGDPEKPCRLNNLGSAHMVLFERTGKRGDIDNAIRSFDIAVQNMPDTHVHYFGHLSNFAHACSKRFEHFHDQSDLNLSVLQYRIAAYSSTGPPSGRLNAAIQWAELAKSVYGIGADNALEAYEMAMELLPRVAWLGSPISSRHRELANLCSLCNEATSTAILMGRYDLALEWLEQGRSVVWTQLLQLRTPMDTLQVSYPKLADDLRRVSRALEKLELEDESQPVNHERVAQSQRRLAEEWESLVAEVRGIPGYEQFLRPRKTEQLLQAARDGPIVVINVHESSGHVLHVPLQQFSFAKAQDLQRAMTTQLSRANLQTRYADRGCSPAFEETEHQGFASILSCLWTDVVRPILDALGYITEEPPRIWWCATGPLAFLPLHAAGIYGTPETGFTTPDYVVSSYTPTITSLLEKSRLLSTNNGLGLLAISQVATPNETPLPNTAKELAVVRERACNIKVRCLEGSAALTNAVLDGLKTSSWVHLACHATQNAIRPTESAFCLYDGRLPLSKMITKSLPHADFAFLSACQTATGDESLPEEAVHLAAGMLFVGFRSVIATMWSIRDKDGPIVAEKVYREFFSRSEPDSRRAAYALHKAVKDLRQEPGGSSFLSWVPFIHIGV